MLQKIRKHLARWSGNKLSLASRILVSNKVILSSIWNLASCSDLFGKTLKIARATIRNYMWSGKKESYARARVKWATAVFPIVRGGIKIIDPQWQASALLVKLLIRGMSVGYEPWKTLVRFRVSQTKQSRRGRWPAHANWIMNSAPLVKQGSTMWQGVMKAWSTIQSGLEQLDPISWAEIMRQPIYGNRFLTNELGIRWGTDNKTNMLRWAAHGYQSLQAIAKEEDKRWKTYNKLSRLRRTLTAPAMYDKVTASIPWAASPRPQPATGQWLGVQGADLKINTIFHVQNSDTLNAIVYRKEDSEQLQPLPQTQQVPAEAREVRVIRTRGPKRGVIDYNPPAEEIEEDQELWLWGNTKFNKLEWDPKEWNWRRIGILVDTTVLNYTTKRGYRVAMRQDNNQMNVDKELEQAGFNSKTRAKFFNRIWHPHLPRKVSAMQWLILTEGLPVGEWRERIGLSNECQLCPQHEKEILKHAFRDCPEICKAWDLYRNTRNAAGLPHSYNTWQEISRGLMTEPEGPSATDDLQWDTVAAYSINAETSWDILRAQLLWAIWCQRVAHAFHDKTFHLGVVLCQAWRKTIYCAMEAYK